MTTQILFIMDALTRYLDEAGITRAEDRISALRRHYAVTWLDMLTAARLNAGFSVFDIDEAIDVLISQLESQPIIGIVGVLGFVVVAAGAVGGL